MKIKISVIIVNYKVKEYLFNCLYSIQKNKGGIGVEVIVVDNDEVKSLGKEIAKNFPQVKYIKSKKNNGFGAGCNLGANNATGDFLFFLNPDTKIVKGKVSNLLDVFQDPNVGAVAPILVDKDNNPYQQGTEILNPIKAIFSLSLLSRIFPNNKIRKKYYFNNKKFRQKNEVDVVPGTALVIKKSLFEEIGRFDEKFFLYFEEFDLCKKLKEKGYKNYISNSLTVFHKWGESTKKRSDINKIFEKSRFYYFKKNYGVFWGLLTEFLLRIKTQHILLFLIICIASFLRFYKLDQLMIFLGDQGWFYLSAFNMLTTGNIPLVGIPSSVVWLHQGPLATYLIALSFYLGNFNPVAPAILFSIFDILTVLIIYLVGAKLFNRWVGLISAFFYATSPLVLISARTPYHTSPVPFFMALLLFVLISFDRKKESLFVFMYAFLTGVLLQLELSNFVIILFIISLFLIKYLKFKKKIIFPSILGFLLGVFPFILYDLTHNFVQTLGFPLWIVNRARLFLGLSIKDETTIGNTPNA